MNRTALMRGVLAPVLFLAALLPLLGSAGLLRRTIPVEPELIQPGSGLAYSFKAPSSWGPFLVRSDTVEAPDRSFLMVLLDGRPIGRPHVLHEEIVRLGGGAFSHWQDYVLFSMPDGSDPRASGSRLSVRYALQATALFGWLFSLGCAWLGLRALCFGEGRWEGLKASGFWGRILRPVLAWGALTGAVQLAHAQAGPEARWALFTLGSLVCVFVLRRGRAGAPVPHAAPRLALGIASLAALLSLASSLVAVSALSTPFNTDAPYYFTRPSEMFATRPGEVSATTPLFGLVFGFIQVFGLKGMALIGLQILVRAWSVFAATRLVAVASPVLGVLLGLLLGIDPVGAALSAMYATESLHSSSLILAAVAIARLPPASALPKGLAVGIGVGLAGLFRPSGIPLLALALLFLAWKARSGRSFRAAIAGVVLAVLMVSSVARLERGSWQPVGGGGGLAYAWPLLVHQLLDPDNGRESAALSAAIQGCDPHWPQTPIRLETDSNERIPAIKTCLVASGRSLDSVFGLFSASYREAIAAQPFRFLAAVRDEFLNYLGTTVSHNARLGAQFVEFEDLAAICRPTDGNPLYARAPALRLGEAPARLRDTLAFVCPPPPPVKRLAWLPAAVTTGFRAIFQPYFYVLEPPFFHRSVSNPGNPWWMGLCALTFGGLVVGVSAGPLRRLALVSLVVVGTAAATVALTHLTTARYLGPFSPWFLTLSSLLGFALLQDAAVCARDFVKSLRHPHPAETGEERSPDLAWKPLWPAKPVTLAADLRALRELFTTRRQLILELTRREIVDRHAGQLLGATWALFQPLLVVGVYLFVFAYIFKGRVSGGSAASFDYPVFLLAGLIPWLGFQESMARASEVIVSNANLVKQVVFPIEILPVRAALSAFFTQSVLLTGLLAYVLVRAGSIPWTYALLPVFLALQLLTLVGLNYFLAAFGVFFRDTRELVQAFAVMGFYFLPTIYSPDSAPSWLLTLLAVNPFSHFVWCAQDMLFFGAIRHPGSWLVILGLSLTVLLSGFRFFRRAAAVFGNLL